MTVTFPSKKPSAAEIKQDNIDINDNFKEAGNLPEEGHNSYVPLDDNDEVFKLYTLNKGKWIFVKYVLQSEINQSDDEDESNVSDDTESKTIEADDTKQVTESENATKSKKTSKSKAKPKLNDVIGALQHIIDNHDALDKNSIINKINDIIAPLHKKPRAKSNYQLFLSAAMKHLQHIPAKQRIAHASKCWKIVKNSWTTESDIDISSIQIDA